MNVRLDTLLHGLGARFLGDAATDVTDLSYDSRSVGPGHLFVALRGTQTDGHRFGAAAARAGASALLIEEVPDTLRGGGVVPMAVVPDTRAVLGPIAARLYGEPGSGMTLIGVTGTNGKTSTVRLVEEILTRAGHRAGSVGTISVRLPGLEEPATLTTPEAVDLQRVLVRMRDAGVDACALEVSSHSLAMARVRPLHFKVAVFTHLSQDHLDFHGSMRDYAEAKAHLFESDYLTPDGTAVLNARDPHSADFAERARSGGRRVLTFARGADADADLVTVSERVELDGASVRLRERGEDREVDVRIPLPGDFQVENTLAAVGAARALGIDWKPISEGVAGCPPIPGRLERVPHPDVCALVDYAHTPDAIDRVLARVRPLVRGRLIAVFGCGGDRDRTKRAPMAQAACGHSDLAIATSDNPRTEDPEAILADVAEGLSGAFEVIVDRREAIRRAVASADTGDAIVILGKGHEDYQIVGTEKRPFDDRLEARRALDARGEEA